MLIDANACALVLNCDRIFSAISKFEARFIQYCHQTYNQGNYTCCFLFFIIIELVSFCCCFLVSFIWKIFTPCIFFLRFYWKIKSNDFTRDFDSNTLCIRNYKIICSFGTKKNRTSAIEEGKQCYQTFGWVNYVQKEFWTINMM